jgi:hypothetical protein
MASPADNVYFMNYENPGKVFIFSNSLFETPQLDDFQNGINKDLQKIENVFGNLNYDVERFCDKSPEEIKGILKDLTHKDYSNYSWVIVFINSHGDLDSVFGVDGEKVYVTEFSENFKRITLLKNKPKLFFVDTCRGRKSLKSKAKRFHYFDNQSSVDEESDLFICYATIQNHVSQFDPFNCSIFIQNFCSILEEDKENKDIDLIIREVNRRNAVCKCLRKTFYFRRKSIITSQNHDDESQNAKPNKDEIPDGFRALRKNKEKIEIWYMRNKKR